MNHRKHKQNQNAKKRTQNKTFIIDEDNRLIITSSTDPASSFDIQKVQDNLPDYRIL